MSDRPIRTIGDAARVWFAKPKRTPHTAPSAPPPAEAPVAKPQPQQPTNPGSRHHVDGMRLSDEDYRRHLAQLGLSAPEVAPTLHRPFGANLIEEQRALDESRRSVERAGRDIEREQRRTLRDREAELSPGSIDARGATPAQVRGRLAQLGLDGTSPNLHVRDVGQPLRSNMPEAHGTDYATVQRRARAVVLAAVELSRRTGQHLDVRRFSRVEMDAFNELRGYGGYDPA